MTAVPQLGRLQREFQELILSGSGRAERWIVESPRTDAATRFNVYAQAYRLRLLEVLGKDYPGLRKLTGEERFDQLGRAYIDAHPSSTPSVRWFGRHLSEFLRRLREVERHALLAEMAEFEWSQGEVFDAPDTPVATVDQVAALPMQAWGGMRLCLHPSVRRLRFAWNVPALWQALEAQQTLPRPQRSLRQRHWLLWRRELRVHWRSLAADEAAALDIAAKGSRFAAICERLYRRARSREAAALRAASLLKRWINDGVLAPIEAATISSSK